MVLGEWNTEKQHHGKTWHPKAFGSTGISLCLQHMSCQKRLSNVFLMCTWRGTNGCMMLSYTQREYIGDDVWQKREREMFYLTTHSIHFIYGYMASDIWLRTILIVRKTTRCRHIGYSYRLTARVILHAPSHIQDNTYHGLCYTSRGALAGTRNSSMGPPNEGSIRLPITPRANALPLSYVPLRVWQRPVSFSSSMVSGVAFVPASWASVGAMLDLIAVPLIKHFLIIIIIILFCTSSLARAFTLYWAVILGLSLAWTTRPLLVMKRAISIEVDDIIVHCCLGATQYSSNLSFCVSFSI